MPRTPQATSLLIKNVRDSILFVIGSSAFAYEVLAQVDPRPIVVGAALLMLGLPVSAFTDRLFQRATEPAAAEPADPSAPSDGKQ